MENKQCIKCDVHSCKHCDYDCNCCTLKEIKVCNCNSANDKEATMCDSYKEKTNEN